MNGSRVWPVLSPSQAMSFSTPRRRKVRKGTRSCWECKRRKIRCMLASPGDFICVGCQHRRVPCVPQDSELAGDLIPSPAKKNNDNQRLSARIARVEAFMNDCLASKHDCHDQSETHRERPFPLQRLDASTSAPSPSLLTPDSAHASADSLGVSDHAENKTALEHLIAALPSEADIKILLKESTRPSRYTHLVNTQPHSKLSQEALAAPCSSPELQYPRPDMHAVMLARLMLTFAITLQSPSGGKAEGLSETPSVLARRLVSAARTWVTTSEDMHGSLECLICMLLEGAYEVNSGNLRLAWSVYRRAMTVAQLMGLHRSPLPPVKRINPKLNADPEYIWFRIVYMDRYLSLLLGLPQGTSDKTMGAPSSLPDQPPLGQFERLLTVIAARILDRNESPISPSSQISTTQSIDAELLGVARSMPLDFWRPANFHNLKPGSPDTLLETLRLTAHVYYHGLLIQLHLPYMIRVGESSLHSEYSKITSANSSREILTRFIAHRTFNPMSSCSRPVDFFALLASMTLLLAYLDAHQDHRPEADTNIFAHQRLGDRAMLDQVLERMDAMRAMNTSEDGMLSEKSAQLIRRLLEMEADAAEGASYKTDSVGGARDASGKRLEDGGLQLSIPHLGIIKISRQGSLSRVVPAGNAASHPQHQIVQGDASLQRELPPGLLDGSSVPLSRTPLTDGLPDCPLSTSARSQEPAWCEGQSVMLCPSVTAEIDDWALQGVDMAFFDGLMRGVTCPDAAGLEQ